MCGAITFSQTGLTIVTVSPDENLLVCGHFNGHVGKAPEGFNRVNGGHGLVHIMLME